jgi:hypothetical protein
VRWWSGVSCVCESSGVGTDRRDCGGVCACTTTPHRLCLESMRRCSDVAGGLSFSVRFLAIILMITTCLSCLPSRYQNRRESGSNTRRREGQGPAVTDRVLRIVIGACTCVAFLLLGAGKNNVMAKWCAPPVPTTPSPTQSTLVDRLDPGSNTLLETSVWSSTGKPKLCSDDMPSGCKHACLWLAHKQPFSASNISLCLMSALYLSTY